MIRSVARISYFGKEYITPSPHRPRHTRDGRQKIGWRGRRLPFDAGVISAGRGGRPFGNPYYANIHEIQNLTSSNCPSRAACAPQEPKKFRGLKNGFGSSRRGVDSVRGACSAGATRPFYMYSIYSQRRRANFSRSVAAPRGGANPQPVGNQD